MGRQGPLLRTLGPRGTTAVMAVLSFVLGLKLLGDGISILAT
ncbi:hypothetical protein ACF08M_37135 [Streptomyces sp. NPDC015032]